MTVARKTIIGKLGTAGGARLAGARVVVDAIGVTEELTADPIDRIVDHDGHELWVGADTPTIADAGVWQVELPVTDSDDTTPTGWVWRLRTYLSGELVDTVVFSLPTSSPEPMHADQLYDRSGDPLVPDYADRVDQAGVAAAAASTSAGQAASSATAAQTARTGAETARTGAEAARDAAAGSASTAATAGAAAGGTAGGTAGASAGTTAATSYVAGQKNAANGLAPLDGSSKLPEGNVPDRLTSTGLNNALDARLLALGVVVDNNDGTATLLLGGTDNNDGTGSSLFSTTTDNNDGTATLAA